jgi:metal-responsive CopG/Arc/MetJ family transcriptional regulator
VAKKKIRRYPAKPRSLQDRPIVSFRIDRPRLGKIDATAERLNVTRSDLISLVLREYLDERADAVDAMINREAERASTVDLFA